MRGRGRAFAPGALAVILALAAVSGPVPVQAQGAPPTEYEVKAAFLFNFAKYVEWPADAFERASDPIVIGVLGEDPFEGALDRTVGGRSVGGRPVVARRPATPGEVAGCHILFVSSSEERRLPAVLREVGRRAVLTVGDMERFAPRGGAIGFIMEERKVRFEINLGAVERAGLKASSQLLKLARIVKEDERRPG